MYNIYVLFASLLAYYNSTTTHA